MLTALKACGVEIEEVDYDTWLQKISEAPTLTMYPHSSLRISSFTETRYTLLPQLQFKFGGLINVNENHSKLAWNAGADCEPVDNEVLQRYFKWLLKQAEMNKI